MSTHLLYVFYVYVIRVINHQNHLKVRVPYHLKWPYFQKVQFPPQESILWSLSERQSSIYRRELSHWIYSYINYTLPFIRKQSNVLLLHTGDQSLREFLLSRVEESRIVIQIPFQCLISTDNIIIRQEQQYSLKIQLLRTGCSQLILHILISHTLQNLQ